MRSQFAILAGIFALSAWTLSAAGQATPPAQHAEGEHTHADAAKLKNTVKATPESIAAGKKLYGTQCANCHGETGKGDGKMAASITTGPKPPDMTDASWKHGSTDGEIYTVIKDGVKGTGMRGYGTRLKPDDMWNLVNYVRTLGPPAKSH